MNTATEIIVRYGELALKRGGTRLRFERRLISSMKAVLPAEAKIKREWGRIFVLVDEENEVENALSKLSKVFGIVSVSPSVKTTFKSLPELSEAALEFAKPRISKEDTFAIRARRAGTHDFGSQDAARVIGAKIVESIGAKVNLSRPKKALCVEIRDKSAYLYERVVDGPGGLPYGIEGKVVCLLSGGIDSPVSSWLAMRRGCEPIFVHADLSPFGDNKHKVMDSLRVLRDWAPQSLAAYIVPHGPSLEKVMQASPHKLLCLMCRRLMFRYAEKIASRENALAIVTGESIGQVASQTLQNIYCECGATSLPILRPLIGMDKVEIENIAKKIGTFAASTQPGSCCAAVPRHPEVAANLDDVKDEEQFLEVEGIVDEAMANTQRVVV